MQTPGANLDRQAIDVEAMPAEIRGLWRSGTQIDLLTSRIPDLGVNDACQFASSLRKLREADGERRRLRLASPSKVLRRRLTSAAALWSLDRQRPCNPVAQESKPRLGVGEISMEQHLKKGAFQHDGELAGSFRGLCHADAGQELAIGRLDL